MTKYSTGNPVGSADPRDLSDNAQNIDQWANSDAASFPDRLGVARRTLKGLDGEFQSFLDGSAFDFSLGDYAAGIEVSARNQLIRAEGDYWRVAASTELPYTTTGAGLPEGGAFVAVGDAVLRQELAASTVGQGSDLIAHTGTADTVTEALDKRTIYVGSVAELRAHGGLIGSVYLQGYYGPGTAGGGMLYVDEEDATSEDNGGTIFVTIDGKRIKRKDASPASALWYGVVGDGSDETAIIQVAHDNHRDLIFPGGRSYGLSADGINAGLRVRSNSVITLEPGASFSAVTGNNTHYRLVYITSVENVTINNLTVVGDRDVNTQTTGEHGMGCFIHNSKNIVINTGNLSKCWGDGLYIGSGQGGEESNGVRCYNVTCNENRRQGLSITSGIDLYFENCQFLNTDGTAPGFGVDIEPNFSSVRLDRIVFNNCYASGNTQGNVGFGMFAINQENPVDIEFKSCRTDQHIDIKECHGPGVVKFTDMTVIRPRINGLRVQETSLRTIFDDLFILDPNQIKSTAISSGAGIHMHLGVSNVSVNRGRVFVTDPENYDMTVAVNLDSIGAGIDSVDLDYTTNVPEKAFRKIGVPTNTRVNPKWDRDRNYSVNADNSSILSEMFFFTIFTNEDRAFLLDHLLGSNARFDGHRVGVRSYNSSQIGLDFDGQLLYPGGVGNIRTVDPGASIEVEWKADRWVVVSKIGEWTSTK